MKVWLRTRVLGESRGFHCQSWSLGGWSFRIKSLCHWAFYLKSSADYKSYQQHDV